MHLRRSINLALSAACRPAVAIALAITCLPRDAASGQTSYVAPDGRNRFPAVTIFCPSGSGVAPCNFGGGSGGASGPVSLTFGGNALSATNRLPVADPALDNLITGGALSIGGTVAVSSLPPVSLAGALPAGSNALGSVTVGNLPATQAVTAATLPLPTGAASDASVQAVKTALGIPLQQTGGSVAVASLPPLPAGANAIGQVSVSNLPAIQAVTAATLPLPAGAASDASVQAVKTALGTPLQQTGGSVAVVSLPPLPAGANAIGQVSVSNLPITQPVSAVAWPLPSGAANASAQTAPLAPVTPAAATATNAVLLGCQASTTLPGFAAGQQGAVPCDTSGRLYVVTVPSANNVPAFLQAVTSGGATAYRAINAAASAMAAVVKSGSGMVYGYEACNAGTAAAYFRLFALAAAPVVGTSVPTLSKLLAAGACQTMTTDIGVVFSTGIAMDVTAGSLADADTTTVTTANQIAVSVYYK
jgi:mRNA-degrading endonuclease toxin of MazEF toxin-antitoxin module